MITKIGRNDPCPCGSGKKFKHCCQLREAPPTVNPRATEAELGNALRAAVKYQRSGRVSQSETILHNILARLPRQPDALHLLGILKLQQGDTESAVNFIKRAIRANPTNPEAHANLGFSLHEQGHLEVASEHYRKALAIKPDYADVYYNQHALLLNKPSIATSIESIRRAVMLNPLDRDFKYMLGVLLDYVGEEELAVPYLAPLASGDDLDRSRLDAWRYLKDAGARNLPICGSMIEIFKLAIAAAPNVGLVLEFGVRFGNTIRQIAGLVAGQPVHGFDSFEGLPEVWHHEPKGSYTTKGEIPKVPSNVTLHVGWFEDTLPKFLAQHAEPVRFVNVDCDIYNSTKTVLDQLAPRMVKGSVLVFDEYIGNAHWREDEFKAFQEAIARYGWSYEYLCFSVFTKQVAVRLTAV